MPSWFSRLFRSRAESHAERAEVDGRFEDAARLYVEAGQRERAASLLLRAAEVTVDLPGRRGLLTRAHALTNTEAQADAVREALARCTLAECEAQPPRNEDERQRLRAAAAELEGRQDFRAAARGWKLLGDARATERVLMLAGDLEGFEREAGKDQEQETRALRRRSALQAFDGAWRSGDRSEALGSLQRWLSDDGNKDDEVRTLLEEKRASLLTGGVLRVRVDSAERTVALRFPLTLGREGAIVLRGAGVSREHALVVLEKGQLCVRDNGSRNGTRVQGLALAGSLPLEVGQVLTLGTDLSVRVESEYGALTLVVERGLDQGRRIVLCAGPFVLPFGKLESQPAGPCVLRPSEPVMLDGQKLVVPIVLARGDRITAGAHYFETL